MSAELLFEPGIPDPHSPELYEAEPVGITVESLGQIENRHIDYYRANGFIAVGSLLSEDQVQSAREAISDLIHQRAPGLNSLLYEAAVKDCFETLSEDERAAAVRRLIYFVDIEPRLKALSELPELLKIVENLLGNKPELLQDMALLKPAEIGREKPWHQDNAYFNVANGVEVVGVWVALDKATPENGCMHVIPGGHLDGPIPHYAVRDWQICDSDILPSVKRSVPLQPGGALIFNGLLPHGTPSNYSPVQRWALQYHYVPAGTPRISQEERMAIWGGAGKDVRC